MELVHITNPDFETMSKIIKIEKEAFEGSGNVYLWIIKALIRYGFVFVEKKYDEIYKSYQKIKNDNTIQYIDIRFKYFNVK